MKLDFLARVFMANLFCSDSMTRMVGQTARPHGCKSDEIMSNFPYPENSTLGAAGMAVDCFNSARDCTTVSLALAFPGLYNDSVWKPPRVKRVRLTPFCRLDNETVNQAGVSMEWSIPDNSGAEDVKGFSIRLEEGWGRDLRCYLIRLSADVTRENGKSTFRGEFYPLSRETPYFVYILALPASLTSEGTQDLNVTTTKCKRPESPSDWCPSAKSFQGSYDVINKTLTISFEAAPFPISKYVIRPSGLNFDTASVQNETSHIYYGVQVGTYSFDIQLQDGYYMDTRKCQCRDDEDRCTHCSTCRGYAFTVPDSSITESNLKAVPDSSITETNLMTRSRDYNILSSRDIGLVCSFAGLMVIATVTLFVFRRLGFTVDCHAVEESTRDATKQIVILERQHITEIGRGMKRNFVKTFRPDIHVDHVVCEGPLLVEIKRLYDLQTTRTACVQIFKTIKIVRRKQACLCISVVFEACTDTNIEQANEIRRWVLRNRRERNLYVFFVSSKEYPNNSEQALILNYRTDQPKLKQCISEFLQIPSSIVTLTETTIDVNSAYSPIPLTRFVSDDSGKGSSYTSCDCAVSPCGDVTVDTPKHRNMRSEHVNNDASSECEPFLGPTTVYRHGNVGRCTYHDVFENDFLFTPPEIEDVEIGNQIIADVQNMSVIKNKMITCTQHGIISSDGKGSRADSLESIMDKMAALNARYEKKYSEDTHSLLTGDVYSVYEYCA